MKNFDRPFGTAAKVVGPTIRNIGKELGFSLYELRAAITDSMSYHGCPYSDETVNGFLHGRPWSKAITRDTTIEVVGRAFELILHDQNKSDKIPEAKGILDFALKNLCESYEKEEIDNVLKKVLAELVFGNKTIEYNPLLNKYFEVCCSLTENDIAFWEIITNWTPEKKNTQYKEWSTKKIDFQTIASPVFRQWLSIFGKNHTKKQNKGEDKKQAPKNFIKRLDKVTGNEAYSLLYMDQRLKDLRELNEKESEKYPFGPPKEIGLLLQFKYCLSTNEQKCVLESEKDTIKAAGDN